MRTANHPANAPKKCASCGTTINRRHKDGKYTESASNYRRRRTCSFQCGRALNAALNAGSTPTEWAERANATRTCTICGNEYKRAKGENVHRFEGRTCCSVRCASQAATTKAHQFSARPSRPRVPAERTFTDRLDARAANTPHAPWKPREADSSPKPDQIPTAKRTSPPRAPQALLRMLATVVKTHPEFATALLDPTFVDITPHTLDRLRAYGGPANAGFNRA